jgi:hypothetical protein
VVDDHQVVRQGLRGFCNGEPDDRRATNLDRYQFIPEDQEPDQPALIEGGGSSGEGGRLGGSAHGTGVRRAAPAVTGPLAFVCAWPGRGIPSVAEGG